MSQRSEQYLIPIDNNICTGKYKVVYSLLCMYYQKLYNLYTVGRFLLYEIKKLLKMAAKTLSRGSALKVITIVPGSDKSKVNELRRDLM